MSGLAASPRRTGILPLVLVGVAAFAVAQTRVAVRAEERSDGPPCPFVARDFAQAFNVRAEKIHAEPRLRLEQCVAAHGSTPESCHFIIDRGGTVDAIGSANAATTKGLLFRWPPAIPMVDITWAQTVAVDLCSPNATQAEHIDIARKSVGEMSKSASDSHGMLLEMYGTTYNVKNLGGGAVSMYIVGTGTPLDQSQVH